MDDHAWGNRFDQGKHPGTVADIQLVMHKTFELLHQSILIPARVTLRPEKHGALIVVHTVDFITEAGEIHANFGADKSGGAGNEEGFSHKKRTCTHTVPLNHFQLIS